MDIRTPYIRRTLTLIIKISFLVWFSRMITGCIGGTPGREPALVPCFLFRYLPAVWLDPLFNWPYPTHSNSLTHPIGFLVDPKRRTVILLSHSLLFFPSLSLFTFCRYYWHSIGFFSIQTSVSRSAVPSLLSVRWRWSWRCCDSLLIRPLSYSRPPKHLSSRS